MNCEICGYVWLQLQSSSGAKAPSIHHFIFLRLSLRFMRGRHSGMHHHLFQHMFYAADALLSDAKIAFSTPFSKNRLIHTRLRPDTLKSESTVIQLAYAALLLKYLSCIHLNQFNQNMQPIL